MRMLCPVDTFEACHAMARRRACHAMARRTAWRVSGTSTTVWRGWKRVTLYAVAMGSRVECSVGGCEGVRVHEMSGLEDGEDVLLDGEHEAHGSVGVSVVERVRRVLV